MKKFLMLLLCTGALVMQAQTVSVKNGPSEKPQKHTDQYFCGYYGKDYGLENKSRHVWIDAKYEGGNVFKVYAQPLRGGEKLTVYQVSTTGEKWLTTDATPVMSVCLDQCEDGRNLSHLGNNSGTMDFSGITQRVKALLCKAIVLVGIRYLSQTKLSVIGIAKTLISSSLSNQAQLPKQKTRFSTHSPGKVCS